MAELRECPFCGYEASKREAVEAVNDGPLWVQCDMCGARGSDFRWEDNATAAWNIRFDTERTATLEREIAALREALAFYADPDSDGYDVKVTDYGLSTEVGDIIKDRGDRARTTLGGQPT